MGAQSRKSDAGIFQFAFLFPGFHLHALVDPIPGVHKGGKDSSTMDFELVGHITVRFYRLPSELHGALSPRNFAPHPRKDRYNNPLMSSYVVLEHVSSINDVLQLLNPPLSRISKEPTMSKYSFQKQRLPHKLIHILHMTLPAPFFQVLLRYNDGMSQFTS